MMADFFKRLPNEGLTGKYVFVWSSLYDLHTQSRAKISSYLGESRYTFLGLEDLHDEALEDDSILFVNWHSLTTQKTSTELGTKTWSNQFVKEREDGRNIIDVLEKTRDLGKELVLIVDEAHRNYLTAQTQQFINEIFQPKLVLEVSATPQFQPTAEDVLRKNAALVAVDFMSVVESGLIKQETLINPNVGEFVDIADSADDLVLKAALSKREELAALYASEGIEVNPLVLVQLPSEKEKTSALDMSMKETVEAVLAQYGISVANNKLAIWLSEEKTDNLKFIETNNSEVEVLIFKEAVAVGWDCPRAQILVMLRDIKSVTFEIQTVGRVLRMPEAVHYEKAELNKAFVFTNVSSMTIDTKPEELEFFKTKYSHRNTALSNVALQSVYLHRQDYGDLTSVFSRKLVEALSARFGITDQDSLEQAFAKADKELELYPEELKQPVIADLAVANLDDLGYELGKMDFGNVDVDVSKANIEMRFRWLMKAWSLPYAPARSFTKMITGFYRWFSLLGFDQSRIDEIQRIITCSMHNQKLFQQVIHEAKTLYELARPLELASKKASTSTVFTVPEVEMYGDDYEQIQLKKYVYEPAFLKKSRSNPEKEIEAAFETSSSVTWWYKNGESRQQYFAVAYTTLDAETQTVREAAFYPDYIVLFEDDSIGIFETKSGITATEQATFDKSNALQEYIAHEVSRGRAIKGGIVNSRKEGLFLFASPAYDPDLSKWERLTL
jgi:type III restriction enzyme